MKIRWLFNNGFKGIPMPPDMARAIAVVFFLSLTVLDPIPLCVQTLESVAASEEEHLVSARRNPDLGETAYGCSKGECTIEWIIRDVEPDVILHRPSCSLPMADQASMIKRIFAEYLKQDAGSENHRTLFWGRIEPGDPNGSWEMACRLALAAFKSPGWDARRGKPLNGDINGFVKILANQEMIYPELKDLFNGFNRTLTFSSAEKVLVETAGKLPFYPELKNHGVKPEDRLPFDCMTWFSIDSK